MYSWAKCPAHYFFSFISLSLSVSGEWSDILLHLRHDYSSPVFNLSRREDELLLLADNRRSCCGTGCAISKSAWDNHTHVFMVPCTHGSDGVRCSCHSGFQYVFGIFWRVRRQISYDDKPTRLAPVKSSDQTLTFTTLVPLRNQQSLMVLWLFLWGTLKDSTTFGQVFPCQDFQVEPYEPSLKLHQEPLKNPFSKRPPRVCTTHPVTTYTHKM